MPTTLTFVSPGASPAGMVIVKTVVPEVVNPNGLKAAVAPAGRLVTLKDTVCANPEDGVSVMVLFTEPPPAGKVIQLVSSEIAKTPGFTESVALKVCV